MPLANSEITLKALAKQQEYHSDNDLLSEDEAESPVPPQKKSKKEKNTL